MVEPKGVDFHLLETPGRRLKGYRGRAEVVRKIAHPAEEPVGDPRRTAGAASDFGCRFLGNLDFEDPGRAIDNYSQVVARVELETVDNAETITQGRGQETGSSRRTDERKTGQCQTHAPSCGTLPNNQIELEVLHRRVQDFFDRSGQSVDLIDEKNISSLKVGQHRREIARTFEDWSRGDVDLGTHLVADDVGEGGLSKTRGAEEESVIQCLATISSCTDEHPEIGRQPGLTDELRETAGPQRFFERLLFRMRVGGKDFLSHRLTLPTQPPRYKMQDARSQMGDALIGQLSDCEVFVWATESEISNLGSGRVGGYQRVSFCSARRSKSPRSPSAASDQTASTDRRASRWE
jgi:hypothetical protein